MLLRSSYIFKGIQKRIERFDSFSRAFHDVLAMETAAKKQKVGSKDA